MPNSKVYATEQFFQRPVQPRLFLLKNNLKQRSGKYKPGLRFIIKKGSILCSPGQTMAAASTRLRILKYKEVIIV
ncbi:hypothetical protein [Pontibacter mangrovi]|uniref:Uncharacterized protein n=1 Tax=Pontibacter mangrovi TaxID=2589816 RepID=A0A501W6A4_9BACT|nr:hypothetical protein [Pontibacter mangrovi]TPE45433.1 hypothetical protein FJM65_05235 [Pontibacter mangrovi]